MIDTILQWMMDYGQVALFTLLLLGLFGLPVPDEVLLTFSGFLIYQGVFQPVPTYLVAFLGSISGITVSFCIGRFVGVPAIRSYGTRLRITPGRMEKVHGWFEIFGKWTLLFGYFIPGFRHIVSIVAGSSKLEYSIFVLFAYTGGLLWSVLYITLGFSLGQEWDKISAKVQEYIWLVALGAAILLALVLLFKKLASGKK